MKNKHFPIPPAAFSMFRVSTLLFIFFPLLSVQAAAQGVEEKPLYVLWEEEKAIKDSDSGYVDSDANDSLYLQSHYKVTIHYPGEEFDEEFYFNHTELPYPEKEEHKQFYRKFEVVKKPISFLDSVEVLDAGWFLGQTKHQILKKFRQVEVDKQKAYIIYKSDVEDGDDKVKIYQVGFRYSYEE